MDSLIDEKDILNCCKVLDRGLYFYAKVDLENIKEYLDSNHAFCDFSYYIRSLAEITVGMTLWFKSDANIKALASAALIDQTHLFIKMAKQRPKESKPKTQFERDLLEFAKDKYYAIPYPDGKVQITNHRRNDERFLDTFNLTSKFMHQDEYSILGLKEACDGMPDIDLMFRRKLITINIFWRMDFRNQVVFINQKNPKIIETYINKYGPIPFDYQEISMN